MLITLLTGVVMLTTHMRPGTKSLLYECSLEFKVKSSFFFLIEVYGLIYNIEFYFWQGFRSVVVIICSPTTRSSLHCAVKSDYCSYIMYVYMM